MTLHATIARPLGGALALLLATSLSAPAFAGSPAPGPVSGAAKARVAAMPRAALTQATDTAAAATTSQQSFLGSTKGKLAVALLAGALGYTFYSMSDDRVKSPAK